MGSILANSPDADRLPAHAPRRNYADLRRCEPAEAEPLAIRVLAIRDSMKDTLAGKSAEQLVQLYEGWGRTEKAAEYRQKAAKAP